MGEIKNTDLPKLHGTNNIFSGEHKVHRWKLGIMWYMDSDREVYSYHTPMSSLVVLHILNLMSLLTNNKSVINSITQVVMLYLSPNTK